MATLRDEHKTYIVTALARFDAPSEVRDGLKEQAGVEASLSQIAYYNPENAQARDLAEKWKALFEETRAAFLADVAGVAAAHKAVRVHRLARMAERAERMRNYPLAASLLEQIAREMGKSYTNRRHVEHSGPDGAPIRIAREALADLPADELLAQYKALTN